MKIEGGERKALEVLLYIANRTSNMYNVLKAIYIADKLHLARYGRLIYPESFIAMDYGPVPSLAYDLVKDVRECRDRPIHDGVF